MAYIDGKAWWIEADAAEPAPLAGVEFGGELSLYDASGRVLQSQDYDTTPVYGATFEFRL